MAEAERAGRGRGGGASGGSCHPQHHSLYLSLYHIWCPHDPAESTSTSFRSHARQAQMDLKIGICSVTIFMASHVMST